MQHNVHFQLPFDLLYGVEVAIRKLRPYANFELRGTEFTQWEDPTGAVAPTWNEVSEQIEKDKAQADLWLERQTTEKAHNESTNF